MPTFQDRLNRFRLIGLDGIRRGVEKEGLRVGPDGQLAMTPHPSALGAALTHPHITTDFSESQLELVTGVHDSIEACLQELEAVHRFVRSAIGPQCMWASSMPGELPADDAIPIGWYGTSNVGRAKRVYRLGLVHRYGARMQTISGIHYNWSVPGASTEDYFALIRNFRRHVFVLLMLFGASPAVTAGFVAWQQHSLQPMGDDTLYLPHATSLRMGRLGYQSDAQAHMCVSYNDFEGYARSLAQALTEPYAPYEAMGIQGPDGRYQQLGTSLLQIENEYYSTIRPKRVTRRGERPLHALRDRGVEYVEVRCMDLQPLLPVGIDAHTMHVLEVFLLWAMVSDSPPDSPQEIHDLGMNQRRVAARGREPGLTLLRDGREVDMLGWADEVMAQGLPVAHALDEAHGGTGYTDAWTRARTSLQAVSELPSAQVLQAMQADHGGSHARFGLAASQAAAAWLDSAPLSAAQQSAFRDMVADSLAEQQRIESADRLPFELYRQQYLDPRALVA